ncbi:hypothetical protein M3Y96_01058400 [Aphelenchoides besseyi]|nr:hypothetical protein M3Y96_01058400 [Aphelenchoides besseyi]
MVRTKKTLQNALAKARIQTETVARKRKRLSESTTVDQQSGATKKRRSGTKPQKRSPQKPKKNPKLEVKTEFHVKYDVLGQELQNHEDRRLPIASQDNVCDSMFTDLRRSFDLPTMKSALRKFSRCKELRCDPLMRHKRGLHRIMIPCSNCNPVRKYLFSMFILNETPEDLLKRICESMDYILELAPNKRNTKMVQSKESFKFIQNFVDRLINSLTFTFFLNHKVVEELKRSPLCTSTFRQQQTDKCEVPICSTIASFRLVCKEKPYDRETFRPIKTEDPQTFRYWFCRGHFRMFSLIHRSYHMFYNIFKNFEHWVIEEIHPESDAYAQSDSMPSTSQTNGEMLGVKTDQKFTTCFPPGYEILRDQCLSNITEFEMIHSFWDRNEEKKVIAEQRLQWKRYLWLWKSRAIIALALKSAPRLLTELESRDDKLVAQISSRMLNFALKTKHYDEL